MTIRSGPLGLRATRRGWAARFLFGALPVMALIYQVSAKHIADAVHGIPFGWTWLEQAARSHWTQAMVASEIAALCAWMTVLAELKLSAAFPLSAANYLLVLGASWFLFHEPFKILQIVGALTILAGIVLLGSNFDDV